MTAQHKLSQHAEWLSLIEVSGPFLAEPILKDAFPQGLEKIDPFKKKQFRQTYEEWREVIDSHDEDIVAIKDQIHKEWINWVIKFGLEWDEDEDGDILKTGDALPEYIQLTLPEHGVKLKPEFAVYTDEQQKPYLLLTSYPSDTKLEEVIKGESWSTTPAERMAQLCRSVGTRLGVVTNGEQWLFIDAPEGGITTYASWYARLWSQEPVTLQAFYSLLNIGTIFNGFEDAKKLTELLDESLKHQDEVTETLGLQVSRAVEVLIQSLDRINHDHNGKLLEGVEPTELYEAGLTLMMRLVFLLCAEERGLLLLGDETYESNYALSTLRSKLRDEAGLHGEEVLSYRKNAWSRLLAIFRAVYGGIEHENMRMPALGGSLFDPDRFPFLEGRAKDSNWKIDAAKPLPIDNRTVLLFLDAIQIYKGRTLSYRALDVEQIGYVYEGLLEKTVVRAPDVTLELNGSKSAKKPWVELKELASTELDGEAAVKKLLKERTGSSAGRIKTDLNKEISDAQLDKLLAACHNDTELRARLKPYYHFLRLDAWDNPLLYPKGSFMVTTGTDRRETGTHYTPKSLTESIVKETLEPIVYVGPAEGKPKDEWQLNSSPYLLDLKICDLAMGSGAFLVQVCRWLADRVCEAWLLEEKAGNYISSEGELSGISSEELLPVDAEERLVVAKRLIAERCLYGVDINPLAVELAKLSIWLVTLSKGRPFGFLDHNLKHGDSLLGLHDLNQLYYLNMSPSKLSEGGGSTKQLFSQDIKKAVEDALEYRKQIRVMPIRDIHDVETMENMEREAEEKLILPSLAADALIGEVLANKGKQPDTGSLGARLADVFSDGEIEVFEKSVKEKLRIDLPTDKLARKPFHWCLEFPEVFENGGFDGLVGNPPFLGGSKITSYSGTPYREYLVHIIASGAKGNADLCCYFLLQARYLAKFDSVIGYVLSSAISEGVSRDVGLKKIISDKYAIIRASKKSYWPGKASVVISKLWLRKGGWKGQLYLDDENVECISSQLTNTIEFEPKKLKCNSGMTAKGVQANGQGFILDSTSAEAILSEDERYNAVLFPYLTGEELNSSPSQSGQRYAINFFDWPLEGDEMEKNCENYPVCLDIVRANVKPKRDELAEDNKLRTKWWQYERGRLSFYKKIFRLERVLVISTQATKYVSFEWVTPRTIFSYSLAIVATNKDSDFAVLNSIFHDIWVRTFTTKNLSLIRYVLDDCFNNFPFPIESYELSNIGKKFQSDRKGVMQARNIGMTEVYNLMNDKNCKEVDIDNLRKSFIQLNNEVLIAYGFQINDLDFDFYNHEDSTENDRYRFTVSSKTKSLILNKLADLNNERAEVEEENHNKRPNKKNATLQSELF